MFKWKEVPVILVSSIVLAFSITLMESLTSFLWILLSVFLIITINFIAKRVCAYEIGAEIEQNFWEMKRYGILGLLSRGYYHPSRLFKRPFPIGIFFAVFSKLIFFPISNLCWMAIMTFDVKTKIYKAAKKYTHPLYSFSEITENQIGIIAFTGILANLFFAILGYLVGLPEQMDFTRVSIFFAFFNLLPISDLDGNKLFFGNKYLWYFAVLITLVGLAYSFLLI